MAGKDIIMMSQEELKRLHVIHKVLDKKLKQTEAANVLGLSNRQIRRITKRLHKEGDSGIAHKSRGRPSNRALSKELKDKVIKLYREKYSDFGPTLANEKLFEIDKIKIGDQTLRNWLIEDGALKVTRKKDKHRKWRERKHHFGEMVQMDGSHHDWFEQRGEECVLMGYIDDAKSTVFARFYEYEGTLPAMDSFKRYIKKYGIPHSLYLDKHTTYKSTAKPTIEDELKGKRPMSQFERALEELGVELIHAQSAPAKGRIERLFRTFQDRVIKEMRLRNITSIDEANKFLKYYLPVFNKRFSIEPIRKSDFHRSLPQNINLDAILCLKTRKVLRNDFTIKHDKKLYQVIDMLPATRAKHVFVEERLNGKVHINYNGFNLKYEQIDTKPPKAKKPKAPFKPKKIYTPPKDHPWRKFTIKPSVNYEKQDSKKEELCLSSTCK